MTSDQKPGCPDFSPQVTFKTPKTSLAGSSSSPLDPGLDRLPFRGLITTSPQCFGTAPCFVDADSAGASDSTVVTMTEGSRAFEDEEETELWSVACGWRWGCGWSDQISMTELFHSALVRVSFSLASSEVKMARTTHSDVRWQIASRASRSRLT